MNLSPRWKPGPEVICFDAVHWSDVGDPEPDDSELAEYAFANDLIVLTQDLDFGALLAACGESGLASFRFVLAISSKVRW